MPYVFNKIIVKPQLPKRIEKLYDISYNLWWSWNTEFLRLFKVIDNDLWESVGKNPVKFLKLVSQDRLEECAKDGAFLKEYDALVKDFEDYMSSKSTWFSKKYSNNINDVIAYFSAEYGLDEIMAIYSGGLGILSGDHLKSASDMGVPLVAVGLLYKNGYFWQKINGYGDQETEYKDLDIDMLPITTVKDADGKDLLVGVKFPKKKIYLKVWQVNVGRVKLYLMDSDIEENIDEYRDTTLTLYGGDQDMRIRQEMVLGMGGTLLLKTLGLKPNAYHMNEGHSSFLTLELMKDIVEEKKVSFEVAKDITSSKTIFTTHTPVPAGNDIFPLALVEKYFNGFWDKLGISKDEFLKLGMKGNSDLNRNGFDMGVLALKIAGKKNGVSKLHGAVSRKLFDDVWPNIDENESPIGYVTNGIHTCTWLAPKMKELFNSYLKPFWQDNIHEDSTWKNIQNIPDQDLWSVHKSRKEKLLEIVKESTTNRLRRSGYSYEEITKIVGNLDPNVLTIGFARRFATYKRATLIFKDLERITQIFSDSNKPIQVIFAGKAHPADKEGQNLIKYIHEMSLKPQFKGKLFILENYNIAMSRYLVTGVDVWLNNPRRPLEASGTSGEKASVNGVINFSVLDGWWAEGYNQKNGWPIGTNKHYDNLEEQDVADSQSLYDTLEHKIIPMYYQTNESEYSEKWVQTMKESIISTGGKYSTSRMLADYTNQLYIPIINLNKEKYSDLSTVTQYTNWKNDMDTNWNQIEIKQDKENLDDVLLDAGNEIDVNCFVKLPNINTQDVEVQAYYGKLEESGVVDDIQIIPMTVIEENKRSKTYKYHAKIPLKNGGSYGYTFRVMPKTDMILEMQNLNMIKWMENE